MAETNGVELGPVQQTFRGSRANAVAGIIIGVIMIVGPGYGIFAIFRSAASVNWQMPFFAEKGPSWSMYAILGLMASAVLLVGVYLISRMPAAFSTRVCFCPEGFYVVTSGKTEIFQWSEVTAIEEIILYEKLPVRGPIGAVLPRVPSISYHVVSATGQAERFSKGSVEGIDVLEKLLRQESASRNIPWKVIEKNA